MLHQSSTIGARIPQDADLQLLPDTPTLTLRARLAGSALWRWLLFLYSAWILCPIRYYAPSRATVDNSWFFAMNYAANHHLVFGRDIVWTWGPLAYLAMPFAMGSNLIHALLFQFSTWAVLIAALWDLMVRSAIPLRNLALFTVFIALASSNYSQDVYPTILLLPIALILLVHFHLRGGGIRLVLALIFLGLLPLLQFVGSMAALAIIGGFVLHRLLYRRSASAREIAMALMVPPLVAISGLWLLLGSLHSMAAYVRSSQQIASGYAIAMSLQGEQKQLNLTLVAFALLLAIFCGFYFWSREHARFFALVLTVPVLFELRHGIVRQDYWHITQFFCFLALVLALLALTIPPVRFATDAGTVIACLFFVLWCVTTTSENIPSTIEAVSGQTAARQVWNVLHYRSLVNSLRQKAQQVATDTGLDAEQRKIIGQQAIAFLSDNYTSALGQNLNFRLFPVVQSYTAFTAYLDELNAQWLSENGPRFLAFDGSAINDRHPWTQTPATWAAVYRWYNTRAAGGQYLLLERRDQARFDSFDGLQSQTIRFGETVSVPETAKPLYWSVACHLNRAGKLRAMLFRVPETTLTLQMQNGSARVFRELLDVSQSPTPATNLPMNLAQFAGVFADRPDAKSAVKTLKFAGPGSAWYQQTCDLRFWQTNR